MKGAQFRFLRRKKLLFLCFLGVLLIFIAVAVFIFPLKTEKGQVLTQNLSNSKNQNSEELFLQPLVIQREYPDFGLLQSNSLIGFSPSFLVDPQALLTLTSFEIRKEIIEYTVQTGDSLWSIAKKFGIYIDTIVWANDIKSALIQPGDTLLILPVDGIMHLVKEGDTVSKLAEKYKTTAEKIIDFNNLKGEKDIIVGEVLIIPGGVMSYSAKIEPATLARLSTDDFWGQSHHFPYGQCTWWVAQKRAMPGWGNAGDWLLNAKAAGYKTCQGRYCIPRIGAVICLEGHRLGHVGYVEEAAGDKVKFSEMNYIGWGRMNYRTLNITHPSIIGYIY